VDITPRSRDERVRVVVAAKILPSFIACCQAATIVLNDMRSIAFYIGGMS
jgi:hypothetical protein